MRQWVPFLLVGIVVGVGPNSGAQSVRYENRVPAGPTRSANRIAEASGVSEWPTLEEGTAGTQITLSGDYHNSDLVIRTFKTYGPEKLLELARRLADELGRPDTDFIAATGRRLIDVDLEFNDYLATADNTTIAEIDLERAVRFLENTDLPRPLGILVDVREGQKVSLAGTVLEESKALSPSAVAPGSVSYQTTRHWYGLVAALLMGALLLSMPVMLYRAGYRMTSKGTPARPDPETEPAASTLTESQQKYEEGRLKGPKGWILVLPFALILVLMGLIPRAFDDMIQWIPNTIATRFLPSIPVTIFLFAVAGAGVGWFRHRKDPQAPDRRRATDPLSRMVRYTFPGLAVMMLVTSLMLFAPGILGGLPRWVLRAIAVAIPGSMLIGIVWMARKEHRLTHTRLEPGDPDHDRGVTISDAGGGFSNVEVRSEANLFDRLRFLVGLAKRPATRTLYGRHGMAFP